MQSESMGGSVQLPGKSGLMFDHILSWLQGKLETSWETGAELHNLTGAMNDMTSLMGYWYIFILFYFGFLVLLSA